MTWGAPITFGRAVGKVTTTEFRLAVVKNGEKLGMCLVIPGVSAKALRWTTATAVALLPGEGEHHGWLRLVASKDPGARRLRATGKSQNLRLVTPLWPWLEGRITEYRPLEVVESVPHINMVDVRLPGWAETLRTPMDDPADLLEAGSLPGADRAARPGRAASRRDPAPVAAEFASEARRAAARSPMSVF